MTTNQQLVRFQQETVRLFYSLVRQAVAPWAPTRATFRRGIAWAGMTPGTYHTAVVRPYVGSLLDPEQYGPIIPRIHVDDHADIQPARSRLRTWADLHGTTPPGGKWAEYNRQLELTVALPELVLFAGWIVRRCQAAETGDPDLLPAPPVELERCDQDLGNLATVGYLWTDRAAQEYAERERARKRQARRSPLPAAARTPRGIP